MPTILETSSYILWIKEELKMIEIGLKGHVNMSSELIIYNLRKVISMFVYLFHLWNCCVKFYESFYWMFMFRVVTWVLFGFVSFCSYPHYTEEVTESTHSVVLTDFNKFSHNEISWKCGHSCRVVTDKLIGMMMLHIFNFSLCMCPNDSEREKSNCNINTQCDP
jgi:hypothetical protein